MKRVLAGVFAVLLLLNAAALPARADDIQTGLVNFICEYYQFQPGDFVPAEFYQVNLEYTGLNLSVLHWYTEEEDYRKGMVAWVAETGEFLADDQVYVLMEEERLLAASEYQRLQEQAGKIDVALYKQIIQGSPQDEYQVYIAPVYNLSDELNVQIQALYEEYGLEQQVDLGSGRVPVDKDGEGGGQSGSSGSEGPGAPPPDLPQAAPLPEPEPDSGKPEDYGQDTPDSSDCEPAQDFYQPYPEEFITALNELYVQGYAQALASLTAYLDSIDAEYEVNTGHIIATLSAEQIHDIQGREDIQWISSYMVELPELDGAFTAQDDGSQAALGKQSADLDYSEHGDSADANKAPWLWSGAILGLLALGAFLVIKK